MSEVDYGDAVVEGTVANDEPNTGDPVLDARLKDLYDHPYYCASCGRLWKYLTDCSGTPVAPHPPALVVSTDELKNRPDTEDKEAYKEWEKGHTKAPNVEQYDLATGLVRP